MKFPYHIAPGLGQLTPGSFVVPFNSIAGAEPKPVKYIPRIGELLPASFGVPFNPILDVLNSPNALKPVRGAGGCGCNGAGLSGLDLSLSASNPLFLIAGAALVWYFVNKG
jgi:hypothetical protein